MNGIKYMPVGEVCASISDTYHGKAEMVTLINTSDVFEGKVLNHEQVQNANLKGQFKKTFQKDDILYSEIRPQNKRFAYVNFNSLDYIASTKLMVIRANTDKVSPMFLYYFLKCDATVAELQTLAETRSGTFPQITFAELANLTIAVPSIAIQEKIVSVLQCIENKIDYNERINDNFAFYILILLTSIWPIISLGNRISLNSASFLAFTSLCCIMAYMGATVSSKFLRAVVGGIVISIALIISVVILGTADPAFKAVKSLLFIK